ncbi:MAG: hypothetical protein SFY80_13065 [Verrucomicrobiota bacterium]|nr:hypothetical protein [Verrucomicrobiota bacterium]
MITQLENHLTICLALYQLALDENHLLKTGQMPDDNILNRKRELLTQLDASLEALKQAPRTIAPQLKAAASDAKRKATQKIQQILLVDRENEQLLLALSLPQRQPVADYPHVSKLKSLYKKY